MKDIFYSEYLDYLDSEQKAAARLIPDIWQLTKNFRTHSGVVRIANSIVDLITYFFPDSIDKLDPEVSLVHGPSPIFIDGCSEDLVVELFQNGDMHSCEFGAEQVVLVRDEATKKLVCSISGNKALVLTILESKGMEFTDCLIYNFFHTSPLRNQWRVLYNAFDTAGTLEARPDFDLQKHSLLCVELKLLYVMMTRARQHLVIYDEDVQLRKPMLDYWVGLKLVTTQPLDDSIRNMFLTVSSPDEWEQRGKMFFERKQFGNASLCYQRAGNEHMERRCRASELEHEAGKVVVSDPASSRALYMQAVVVYMQIGGLTAAAARCCQAAGEYADAAKLYLELRQFTDAAINFEKGKQFSDAASAYQESGDLENSLRCWYHCKDFDNARLCLGMFQGDVVELKIKEHYRKGAIHFHKERSESKMLDMVHHFASTDEKRMFLKRYGHEKLLLSIELADGCFKEAAVLCEQLNDFEQAASCYFQAALFTEGVRCVCKRIRLQHTTPDFMLKKASPAVCVELNSLLEKYPTAGHAAAVECESVLLQHGPPCVNGINVSIEKIRNLIQDTVSAKEGSVWNAWKYHFTAIRFYLGHCTGNGVEKFKKPSKKQKNSSAPAAALEPASMDFEDHSNYIGLMESAIHYVLGPLSKLAAGGSISMMASMEKQIVYLVVDYFELKPESSMSKNLLGSSALLPFLPAVFGISTPAPLASGGVITIGLMEFAQCSLKFIKNLFSQALQKQSQTLLRFLDSIPPPSFTVNANHCREKRVAFDPKTSQRLAVLITLHKNIERVAKYNDLKSSHGVVELKTGIVHLLLPDSVRLENVEDLAEARKDGEAVMLLGEALRSSTEFRKSPLPYDRYARLLLLAELAGLTRQVTQKLASVAASESRKLKNQLTVTSLINAYNWEICPASKNYPEPLLRAALEGSKALVQDFLWRDGALNNVLKCKIFKHSDFRCYSPISFIKLVEKYFVNLMCYRHRFSGLILPSQLVTDVMVRIPHPNYANAVREYRSAVYDVEDMHHPINIRVGKAKKWIFQGNGSDSLVTMLLDILFSVDEKLFERWLKENEEQVSVEKTRDCLSIFVVHAVTIAITFAINTKSFPEKKYVIDVLQNGLKKGDCILSKTPLIFDSFIRKLSANNTLESFAEICRTMDSSQLFFLDCTPTGCTIPPATKRFVVPKVFSISNDFCVTLTNPALPTSADARQLQLESVSTKLIKEQSFEDEEYPASSATAGDDLALDETLIAPLMEDIEETKITWMETVLLQKSASARKRLQGLSPLDKVERILEKEFIASQVSWRGPVACLFKTSLCSKYILLLDWHEKMESYVEALLEVKKPMLLYFAIHNSIFILFILLAN